MRDTFLRAKNSGKTITVFLVGGDRLYGEVSGVGPEHVGLKDGAHGTIVLIAHVSAVMVDGVEFADVVMP